MSNFKCHGFQSVDQMNFRIP
eukprot:UN11606